MKEDAILITGATSDLGIAYLNQYEKNKVIIALYHSSPEKLDEIIQRKGLNIIKINLDLTDLIEVKKTLENISKEYNISEVLHMASPKVKQERFNKIEIETYQNDYTVQFLSIVEILRVLIPNMKKQKKGKILIILSSCTIGVPPKFWTSYVSTKYALLGLIKSLTSEYSNFGIQVNGISPSMMQTKFLDNMDERTIEMAIQSHPQKRAVKLEEVIEAINFLLNEESTFIAGQNLVISGGEVF